jgi:hypothetical protein
MYFNLLAMYLCDYGCWLSIPNRLLLVQNHPGGFYWEDKLLQNMSPCMTHAAQVYDFSQVMPTLVPNVKEFSLHGNSGTLGRQCMHSISSFAPYVS